MNAERLLKLADLLDTIPPERFDYGRWVGAGWDGNTPLTQCGTTACALGWATTIPEFRLRLVSEWNGRPSGGVVPANEVLDEGDSLYWTTIRAARETFGINGEEAYYLFVAGPDAATADYVSDKIRVFVREGGIPDCEDC